MPSSLAEPVKYETGALPGEVTRLLEFLKLHLASIPAGSITLPDEVLFAYRREAVRYFVGRISALLRVKEKFKPGDITEQHIRRGSAAFAQRIFSGKRLRNPPALWQNYGLVQQSLVTDDWALVCPAVQRAVVEYIASVEVLDDVIRVLVRSTLRVLLY